jgi:tetratricopeptide (TPR) repeat protein
MTRLKLRTALLACTTVASLAVIAPGIPAQAHETAASAHDHAAPGLHKTEVGPFARQAGSPDADYLAGDVPLWDNLGTVTWPVTVADPMAQRYFDQGLRLSYAFNHAEAGRAFRKAREIDPTCAMCYWGEAFVLGPNINAPMDAAAVEPAFAAIAKAQSAAPGATDKERALIAAMAKRYSADPNADRAALNTAFAKAMDAVAAQYPDDPMIAVLQVESLMNLSPWDYWQAGGMETKGRAGEAIATLERVLAAHPDHPGAIHYYIHLVEASNRPERAEPHAERLAALMPGAGHLVHMPSHIYYRVGRWLDSLEANKAAAAADEAYLARIKASGIYPQGYYPHNIHFLLVSAQMAGDGRTAVETATKLQATVSDEAARTIAWVQPIKVAPYFAHSQFSPPETILAIPDPGDDLPFVKAMWHYARGIARVRLGDFPAAKAEAETIAAIGRSGGLSTLIANGVPADAVLELARHVVLGRAAQAQGDLSEAIEQFQAAVAREDGLAYMEPPFWYYPVRQSLGAALLQAGRIDEAEHQFHDSLRRVPNNGWALFGLMEVHKARGDQAAAMEAESQLDRTWAGDRDTLDLALL